MALWACSTLTYCVKTTEGAFGLKQNWGCVQVTGDTTENKTHRPNRPKTPSSCHQTPPHLPPPTSSHLHMFNNSSNDSLAFSIFIGGTGKINSIFLQNKQQPKNTSSKGTLCEERTVRANWDNRPMKGTWSLTANLLCGRTIKQKQINASCLGKQVPSCSGNTKVMVNMH